MICCKDLTFDHIINKFSYFLSVFQRLILITRFDLFHSVVYFVYFNIDVKHERKKILYFD